MLGTRHEEYVNFTDNIPFVFHDGILRTDTIYSSQVNWHENLEIQYCISGNGEVLLDGRRLTIERGDIIAANSNVLHHTGTRDKLVYGCLIFESSFCRQALIDPSHIFFEEKFKSEIIIDSINKLKATYSDENDACRIAKLRAIALEILIELRQNHTLIDQYSQRDENADFKIVKDTVKFVREHYSERLSLDEISKNVYTNKYSLTRIFKRLTGETVVGYINGFRCKQAMRFLSDGYTVFEASRLCGFFNTSFFIKTFKKYTGALPSEFKIRK